MAVFAAALARADAPVVGAGPLAVSPPVAHPLRITLAITTTALSHVLQMPSIDCLPVHTLELSQKRCQDGLEVAAIVLDAPCRCWHHKTLCRVVTTHRWPAPWLRPMPLRWCSARRISLQTLLPLL